MNLIKYELIYCEIGGKKVYFKGIKIDEKIDAKRVTHSGEYKAKGYVTGDETVDFTLTEPKDQRIIHELYELWKDTHQMSDIFIFARNIHTNNLEPVVILNGCVITKIDRNVNGKDEWKPSVSGMALECKHINYQFESETGVGKHVTDALTSVDTISANTRGVLNLGQNVANTFGRFIKQGGD